MECLPRQTRRAVWMVIDRERAQCLGIGAAPGAAIQRPPGVRRITAYRMLTRRDLVGEHRNVVVCYGLSRPITPSTSLARPHHASDGHPAHVQFRVDRGC